MCIERQAPSRAPVLGQWAARTTQEGAGPQPLHTGTGGVSNLKILVSKYSLQRELIFLAYDVKIGATKDLFYLFAKFYVIKCLFRILKHCLT